MPVQIIEDGPRNVVVKVTAPAAETGTAIDVSTLTPPCGRVNIFRVWYSTLDVNEVVLLWDATADVEALRLHGSQDFCFDKFGGITNNAGAGVTGDLLYDIDNGTVVIWAVKHDVQVSL